MGRFKKFNKEKLPDKIFFCRSVKDKTNLSCEDYLTSKKFWNKFNIGRRSINHFKKDVSLLAYVFEKFIDTCLKFYKLDHCHYVSFP